MEGPLTRDPGSDRPRGDMPVILQRVADAPAVSIGTRASGVATADAVGPAGTDNPVVRWIRRLSTGTAGSSRRCGPSGALIGVRIHLPEGARSVHRRVSQARSPP